MKLLKILLFLSLAGIIYAQPEIIYGCTDPDACNYVNTANNDDGSCLYSGDINFDGILNVADIVMLVEVILDDILLDDEEFCAGDYIQDGEINVVDVVLIVAEILTANTVTDIDGNVYATVQIGEQIWMQENLKVTRYKNGDEIQYVQKEDVEPDIWENLTTGGYGYYNDDSSLQETYGNLYNWYAVDDERGICPQGWHVPSDEEYTVLTDYLGGESIAGGKMKETGTEYWCGLDSNNCINIGATNESGFTGLPSGKRYGYSGGGGGDYLPVGLAGIFWTSTEHPNTEHPNLSQFAFFRVLDYSNSELTWAGSLKRDGHSIRCLKD